MKDGALAVEGFETRVWMVRDPDRPGRFKPQPIPAEIVARFRQTLLLRRLDAELLGDRGELAALLLDRGGEFGRRSRG